LEKKYKSGRSELLVMYGRRRIGKTSLILKFSGDKDALYFMGRLESREDTLRRFNNLLIAKFNDENLLNSPLQNFDAIFGYISNKCDKRMVLVIDEFPFLVDKFPEIVSVLQDKWDDRLKNTKIMIILLGSSVGMMEKYALDYKGPLYGRRTGQWKLEKFSIQHLAEFFPKYSQEEIIYVYSAIDSIPGYLNLFEKNISFFENVKEKIFSKGEFLYEEVEILMREELRDPSNYMSIISGIAGGLTSFNEIQQKTRLDKSLLSKYLSVLESLNIVEKIMPVTEGYKSKLKSKGFLYSIKDNFFDFWFRFVYINKQEIEKGNSDIILRGGEEFNRYVSFKFEEYCKEIVPFIFSNFIKIGKWWHKDKEIDIVALNEKDKEILFAECKWQDNVDAKKIVDELKEKSQYVEWNNDKRKESFAVFAKSFSKKIKEFEGKKVHCFDIKDLEKVLQQ